MSLDIGPSRYLGDSQPHPGVLSMDDCTNICAVLCELQTHLINRGLIGIVTTLVGSAAYEYGLTTGAAERHTPDSIRSHNNRRWRPRSKDAKPVDFDILLIDNWLVVSECRVAVELAADWVVNTFQPVTCTIEPRQLGITCDFSNGSGGPAPAVADHPDGFVCRTTLANGRRLDIMAAMPWTSPTEYQTYMPIPEARWSVGAHTPWKPTDKPIVAGRPTSIRFNTIYGTRETGPSTNRLIADPHQSPIYTKPFVSYAIPLVKTILWGLRWNDQLNSSSLGHLLNQPFPLEKLNYLADKYGTNYGHPPAIYDGQYLFGSQLLNQLAYEQLVWTPLIFKPRDYLAPNETMWLAVDTHRAISSMTGDTLTQKVLNDRYPNTGLVNGKQIHGFPTSFDYILAGINARFGWWHDGTGALEVTVEKK